MTIYGKPYKRKNEADRRGGGGGGRRRGGRGGGWDSNKKRVKWAASEERILNEVEEAPEVEDAGFVEEKQKKEEEDREEEEKEERLLALHAPKSGKLAAAYYEPETRKLYVLEDTKNTTAWDLACLVMEQYAPDKIVVSTKIQDSLMDQIEAYVAQNPSTSSVCQPYKHFEQGSAIFQLSQIRLPDKTSPLVQHPDSSISSSPTRQSEASTSSGTGHGGSKTGTYKVARTDLDDQSMRGTRSKLVKLGCWVNVDAELAVSAAGGLLTYVAKQQAGKGKAMDLGGIESMALDQYMLINSDALQSLAIIGFENHALMHSSAQKKSLSLLGALDTCVTPLGKKLLHSWLLRPLLSIPQIEARHDAVEVLSQPSQHSIITYIVKCMKGVKNLGQACWRIRRGRAKYADWNGLFRGLSAGLEMRELMYGLGTGGDLPIIEKVQAAIHPELEDFVQGVLSTVDWDSSKDSKYMKIRPGVDDELDVWREKLAGMGAVLTRMAHKYTQTIDRNFYTELNAVYFPQLGYLVAIRRREGDCPLPVGWEIKFESESIEYYSTPETINMIQFFGDLENMIMDREIEVMQALTEVCVTYEGEILKFAEVVAELDCLIALANAARTYSLIRPEMVEEPKLIIREGRHLLQEMCVDKFIHNDTLICGGMKEELCSMMIVTGANGSGKSAYGKQVALITFMAQIGCFVPAKSAIIGVCDKIFTRLQTKESVSKASSAFMIDLSQVSHALRGATEKSLIILDEFGKGTAPVDGAGLLAGVIEHLIAGPCPRTIVLTHFHELFTHRMLDQDLPILFCYMKTVMQESLNGLTYLFKLTPGSELRSFAAECALYHGVPRDVVERASEVSELISKFDVVKLHDANLTQEDVDAMQQAEGLMKRFLGWSIAKEVTSIRDVLMEIIVPPGEVQGLKVEGVRGENRGIDKVKKEEWDGDEVEVGLEGSAVDWEDEEGGDGEQHVFDGAVGGEHRMVNEKAVFRGCQVRNESEERKVIELLDEE